MSNGVEQTSNSLTVTDFVTILTGVALFARWLLSTGLGRMSLTHSKPRRNYLAPAMPILLCLAWYISGGLLQELAASVAGHLQQWHAVFLSQLVYSVESLGFVAIILLVARVNFVRGLKGLGLRLRTVPKDLGLAFVTLWGVWPLVLAAMSMTVRITQLFYGHPYQVPQHEALKLITESPALSLKVLLVVVAVVVAPVVEEMLFRGLFQTTIRSYLGRPWPAIVLTSLLFASIHSDVSHWPALFVLALGLGYAYEKSGSLLRSIFMHAMFNGITIAAVLTQSPAGR